MQTCNLNAVAKDKANVSKFQFGSRTGNYCNAVCIFTLALTITVRIAGQPHSSDVRSYIPDAIKSDCPFAYVLFFASSDFQLEKKKKNSRHYITFLS